MAVITSFASEAVSVLCLAFASMISERSWKRDAFGILLDGLSPKSLSLDVSELEAADTKDGIEGLGAGGCFASAGGETSCAELAGLASEAFGLAMTAACSRSLLAESCRVACCGASTGFWGFST